MGIDRSSGIFKDEVNIELIDIEERRLFKK
jgi:hypothetical protein